MIEVFVNGEPRQLAAGSTVADLVAGLKLPERGVAVAVDNAVVPRGAHASTPLVAGQRVEIIRAVGGG